MAYCMQQIDKNNKGLRHFAIKRKCPVCNYYSIGQIIRTRENMFGLGGTFYYHICKRCGSAAIINKPKNMEKYYPETYLSKKIYPKYKNLIVMFLFKLYLILSPNSTLRKIIDKRFGTPNIFQIFNNMLEESKFTSFNNKSILDVGSGTGQWLIWLSLLGFKKRVGVDPFIKSTIQYNKNFKILKGDIRAASGKFDFITSNHSIEHAQNPQKIIKFARKIINNNGLFMIRTPLIDSYAFKKYGSNWVDLDPPRHLVLLSKKAMYLLASKFNFNIVKIIYDSNESQFIGSELYKMGLNLSLSKKFKFTDEQLLGWKLLSDKLNSKEEGDQACFILKPI